MQVSDTIVVSVVRHPELGILPCWVSDEWNLVSAGLLDRIIDADTVLSSHRRTARRFGLKIRIVPYGCTGGKKERSIAMA